MACRVSHSTWRRNSVNLNFQLQRCDNPLPQILSTVY
jgi:hypothetical protein